jgi:hypothetical protein
MRFHSKRRFAIMALTMGFATASAGTIYNEAISGDLSNDGLNPTVLTFAAGDNLVLGTSGGTATTIERDDFTFTVPAGMKLTSILELAGTQVGDSVSLIWLVAGTQITLPVLPPGTTGLLGLLHYRAVSTDTELINDMAIGFTPPLGPGDYSVWIQDLSPGPFNYGFDFVFRQAGAVPEPGTLIPVLLGLAGFALRRYRKPEIPSSSASPVASRLLP